MVINMCGIMSHLKKCGGRRIPDASWDGTPYTPKAINVRLPVLTGEIDPVSIDSRDINAKIGAFMTPK